LRFLTGRVVWFYRYRQAVAVSGDFRFGVNYGFDRVRFPAPVIAGSRVRARVTLKAMTEEKEHVEIIWSVILERESGGKPALADGRLLDVTNVVWATGFHPGFSWIDLPIFGADGLPEHEGGEVAREPGLFFVGLHFLYSMSSEMIHGVGRDADRIAGRVAERAAKAGEARRSKAA